MHRLIRFGLVGVATAAIYVLTGTALWRIAGIGKVSASSLAFLVAVTFNYAAQKSWSFQSSTPHRLAAARYLFTIAGGMTMNAAVIHVGAEVLGWHFLLAQLLAMGTVILWNFVLFSVWVFRA
jgi:putative flippase GtrA